MRVVSMPCTSVFDRQDAAYRASVLPARRAARRGRGRASPTAGASTSAPPTTRAARVVGIDAFGESAPAPVLFKHFGLTAESVVAARVVSRPSVNPKDTKITVQEGRSAAS